MANGTESTEELAQGVKGTFTSSNYTLTSSNQGLKIEGATPFAVGLAVTPSGTATLDSSPSLFAQKISLSGMAPVDGDVLRIVLDTANTVSQTLNNDPTTNTELATLLASDLDAVTGYRAVSVLSLIPI